MKNPAPWTLAAGILGIWISQLHAQAPYSDYVGAGQAADISVTASSFEEGSEPIKTVDGTGLSGSGHGNLFDTGWQAPDAATNPVPGRPSSYWLRYDLGHTYQLGTSTFWNYNEEEATSAGLRSVSIDTSVDGSSWTTLGTYELPQAPGTANYTGMIGPDFGGVSARYVVLTAHTNWGDPDYWGLAEIRIDVHSTPVAGTPPDLQVNGMSGGMVQLSARTASDASLSQLQTSDDLVTWYAVENYAGASMNQTSQHVATGSRQFFRLSTMNDGGAIPTFAANRFDLFSGQSLVLSPAVLDAADTDSAAGQLSYAVSSVTGGRFELVSHPGVAVGTFTQAQVNGGQVQFVHDGSTNAPTFQLGLSDGMNMVRPVAGSVTFDPNPPANQPPALVNNALTVNQGASVVVTNGSLLASDSDNTAAQLTFTVSGVTAGMFVHTSNPSIGITVFTQAEVNANSIRFVHDNSVNAPSYSVRVSDGEAATTPSSAMITFIPTGTGGDAPVLIANSQATSISSSTVLSQAQLDATDPDSPASSITYTISNISGGRFERISNGSVVTSFAQTDIDNRAIRFVQDGTTTQPAYHVSVSDGGNTTSPAAASISFCDGTHTSMMTATEMANLNNLVQLSQVTHTVVASGKWSDTAVWQNGALPAAGARIHIPSGFAVVIDTQLTPEFESIRIDGMLRFAPDVNTRLRCDTIVSYHCGRFEVGTAGIPIADDVTCEVIFADDGPIDTNFDFAQLGRGAILHGKTVIYGAERTNKVALAVHPVSGTSVLQLTSAPVGWKVGDELIVTGTTPNDPRSDEIRTISAINGSSVTLHSALSRDHVAPRSDLNVYVANATRNVVFSSENSTIARRGHLMIMHTLDADLNYARFYQMGRTDKTRQLDDVTFSFAEDVVGNETSATTVFTTTNGARTNIRGRYPVHFHRGGTDPSFDPGIVNGCVVYDGPGWGIVMHSAHCRFLNNVTYAIQGTGYYTEAGDEVGEMVGNIAIRSVNSAFAFDSEGGAIDPDLGFEQQEFGNDGDGYWLSGNLVAMRNNVSAGSTAHGIIYWVDGLVEADIPRGRASVKTSEIANGHLLPGRDTIPTWWAPLAEVSGNECYGSSIGFRARYIHAQTYIGEGGSAFHQRPTQAYIDTLDPVVENLTVWGNRDGVLLNYNERMSVKNSLIVGIGAPFVLDSETANSGVGLDNGTEVTDGSGRIENVTIEGFEMGWVAPRSSQWVVENLTLKNVTDIFITEPRLAPRTLTMNSLTFGNLTGTAVAGRGGRRNILLQPEFDDGSYQPFFFVLPDRITLDGEGIYFNQQAASNVLLTVEPDASHVNIPSTYINRTNQQIFNTHGVSFGGAFHPSNARNDARVVNGVVGSPAPAPTVFPQLLDMTNEGFSPEPAPGGTNPEFTANRLEIRQGQTLTLMETNLNTTDTNTGIASLTYTMTGVNHGFFAHRNAPTTPITSFTQAEVNGGVIRFVHNGTANAPTFNASVSDGSTSTSPSAGNVSFTAN